VVEMEVFTISVDKQGRVVIPAKLREAAQIEPGQTVQASVREGQIVISTPEAAIKRVQRIVREKIGTKHSLVDDLMRMRREEFKLEDRKFRARRKKSA
jgi:AbrB family looped-hinge helix DNA binding protein